MACLSISFPFFFLWSALVGCGNSRNVTQHGAGDPSGTRRRRHGRRRPLPSGRGPRRGAPVSDYFKPRATGVEVEGVKVEDAFFRGRKLQGATLALPDGYRGYVLGKRPGQNSDVEVSNFVSRAEFQKTTYWNHDTMPSAEDSIPRCFHWLTVANAMHKSVTAEDLANMSATQNQDNQIHCMTIMNVIVAQ